MSDLKTATRAVHELAEHTEMSKMLVGGDFTKEEWGTFLSNQYHIRKTIEDRGIITEQGLLTVPKLLQDISDAQSDKNQNIAKMTDAYCKYLSVLPADKLWSHIYSLYMGDLFGGQMIRKALKDLPTSFLTFEERQPLIQYVREKIAEADEVEAVVAFQFIIHIYNELHSILRDK